MIKNILDRQGNVIGIVHTVRNELEYRLSGETLNEEEYDNLAMADFSGKNLENADFRGMNLSFAKFRQANLKRADFREADVSEANFYESDLEGADFRGADLSGTMYATEAVSRKIIFDDTTKFQKHHHETRPSWM